MCANNTYCKVLAFIKKFNITVCVYYSSPDEVLVDVCNETTAFKSSVLVVLDVL